ncbi:MAG: DUF3450 family protein [Emcibacter sp.]|nr:DUF3450 family protein [Emcibacter sp.]
MEFVVRVKSIIFNYFRIFLVLILPISIAEARSPQDVRVVLQEWVETERLISKEDQIWQQNKAALGDVLTALGKEEQILKERINTTQHLTVTADKERSGLLKERGEYQEFSRLLAGKIGNYERQVIKLLVSLPPLLQQELAPFTLKLRNNSDLSLSVRARTVVNIISQIEKFDNAITLSRDVRRLDAGKEVEVDVLYIGLAQAFYVDKNAEHAGWGDVTEEGWDWQENNDLAGDIKDAIDIYESRKSPELVELPLKIKSLKIKIMEVKK